MKKQSQPIINPADLPIINPADLEAAMSDAKHKAIDQAAMKDIGRVATLGLGAGVGLRGLYGLLQTLGRAANEPPASIPASIMLDVPIARKREEQKRRAGMKLAEDELRSIIKDTFLPNVSNLLQRGLSSTGKFLTASAAAMSKTVGDAAKGEYADSPIGRPLYIPGMIGAGIGAGAAGYKLTDWLLDGLRKGNTEDELEQAKREYEDALYGKTAEAVDELYDAVSSMQKNAGIGDVPGATTGAYLTYALGAPLLVGSMVYNNEKKQQRKKLIDAAQNLRRRMRHESSPPPVYINPVMPGEEKLSAEAKPKIRTKSRKKKLADKPDNSAWLGYGLGGDGLGGMGAFLAGTEPGRGLIGRGVDKIRQTAQQIMPLPDQIPGELKEANNTAAAINRLYDKIPSELVWTLLAGAGGAAGGALYSPRHSPGRGAVMGGLAGLGAGAGLATGNSFMDSDAARNLKGTLYGQAPVVLGATGLGGAAGLRAGRSLADSMGLKGRKEKGDDDLSAIDLITNPELRDRVLA